MTSDDLLSASVSARVRQRFTFFEQRIYWEGRVSRLDLTNRFAISAAQASLDIAQYRDLVPDNVTYDASLKEYVGAPAYVPRFFVPDARQYLTQLLLIADHALHPADSWLGAPSENDAVPRVRRKLSAEILRPIVLAIRRCRAIEVEYQSFSAPDPEVRLISPHALFFDGARWSARAWCYRRSRFADFVMARVLRVGDTKPGNVPSSLDGAWTRFVTLRLGTNQQLSKGQQRALELDYGMTDGVIDVRMRLSTVYYFIRHFGFDLDADTMSPERRQIVWLNRDEIASIQQEVTGRGEHGG
jgi:hypothetical protein